MKIKDINVLPKPGESIHFKGNRVTKYFDDGQIVRDRVERAKILKGIVPELIAVSKNSYSYKFIPANLLSEEFDVLKFEEFLKFCQKKLWSKKPKLDSKGKKEFLEKCRKFYFNKTNKRLEKLYKDTGIKDRAGHINGKKRPTLSSLLKKIDWQELSNGVPALFHGDLQPENILVTKKGFTLIDWRHDFEGLKEYGDIYYDFAKLYHALIVSNEIIRNEQYEVKVRGNDAQFHFLMKSNLIEFKNVFDEFIVKNGYNLDKTKILSALIFLNIAALHHYPYNVFLYYLGKDSLYECLNTLK
ncbi:MAG: phosphotransferase [bacterium]|nr:phosphotransferase [bacterium]